MLLIHLLEDVFIRIERKVINSFRTTKTYKKSGPNYSTTACSLLEFSKFD